MLRFSDHESRIHKVKDATFTVALIIFSLIVNYAFTLLMTWLAALCFDFEWSIVFATGVFIIIEYITIMLGGSCVSEN